MFRRVKLMRPELRKLLPTALALMLPVLPGLGQANDTLIAQSNGQGIIQELDFAKNRMMVQGVSYQVSPEFKAQIGGSHGAFTMLEPGMRVDFVFNRHPDGSREVLSVRELSANEPVFEH